MADLQKRLGMGLIFITHDLNIVRRIADRVYVMRYGEVVEEGETARDLRQRPSIPIPRRCSRPSRRAAKQPVPRRRRSSSRRHATSASTFKLGGGFLGRRAYRI